MLDFDKLSEAEGKVALKGCDVGFCALGTTRGKSGVVSACVVLRCLVAPLRLLPQGCVGVMTGSQVSDMSHHYTSFSS